MLKVLRMKYSSCHHTEWNTDYNRNEKKEKRTHKNTIVLLLHLIRRGRDEERINHLKQDQDGVAHVSENADDEGPTAEDEDPAAGDEGLAARVEGPGTDDESYGLDDLSHGMDDESRGLDDEGHSVESNGLSLEEEEEAVPGGQQQVAPVVGIAVSAPLGLGYRALIRRELALEEDHPTLTTWINQENGIVYIDVPTYPPPPPVQTPPSLEWTSGLLPISPSPSVVHSPISSPMIPLTVPSHVALLATAETKGFLTELGAQVQMQEGLIHVLALESWGGQTDAQRVALWHAISDIQGENRDLWLQLAEERRARLELAKVVDSIRRGQKPRGAQFCPCGSALRLVVRDKADTHFLTRICAPAGRPFRCVKSKVYEWYWKSKDVTQGNWVEMVYDLVSILCDEWYRRIPVFLPLTGCDTGSRESMLGIVPWLTIAFSWQGGCRTWMPKITTASEFPTGLGLLELNSKGYLSYILRSEQQEEELRRALKPLLMDYENNLSETEKRGVIQLDKGAKLSRQPKCSIRTIRKLRA
ncbi:hypothetical protein Tco_1133348 [Tanacetum coccineum]